MLGRYQLGPLLGVGAAGRVFQTHDQLLGRTVALKILNRELWQSPKARERMAREAAALGRVTHPNVVAIHNVFEHESALILELEYVEGGTLADRMRRGPVPLPEALRMMTGILAGLGAIHGAGVVHRDLKPANILLTRDRTPKIADLGVARDTTALAMTARGTRLGTLEYMSPEQIREEGVGPPSDLYACGVLLYELVSGTVPFAAKDDFEVMAAHLHQPPDLKRLEAHAPPELVQAIGRALAKTPAERWRSAHEFGHALARVGGRLQAARPRHHASPPAVVSPVVSAPPHPPRQSSAVKLVAVLLAVAFFLGVLLLGVLLIGYLAFGFRLP